METHFFTREEASALLPWLESEFQKIFRLIEKLDEAENKIKEKLRLNGSNGHISSLKTAQKSAAEYTKSINEIVQRIQDKGIIVRDLKSGLVDFSSIQDEENVFLCWIYGEDSIRYWHNMNEGYSSRKLL
mgnify:FL=1|tara:strand:- start:3118 stop:3507 length:390 start_codon:yes stop_codon:yes gene_type:complete